MFSDKFTEINNYSLFKKEYESTSSIMPWRLTSVNDDIYKPILSENIKNRLKLFFYFRYQYTDLLLEDDEKYLEITHKDNKIFEFNSICFMESLPFTNIREWCNFINTIEAPHLDECLKKMLNYQEEIIRTSFLSTTFDENCDATGIYIAPNLDVMRCDMDLIHKLNDASKEMSSCSCFMHINPKDNSLRYKILPNYSDRAIGFLKTTKHSLLNAANAIIEKKYYDDYTKECVEILVKNELITQEMVEYMKEVMPENTKFSLEYLIDSENNLTDIILHNTVIEKFIDISEEQRITRETERRPYTI